MEQRPRRRAWRAIGAAGVLGLVLLLVGCGDDIQLDRSSLQELYGTDHKHADCIADRLEDDYSDSEIEQIDQEVRDIEDGEKSVDQASDLFHRFDDDLHAAAIECGIDAGPDDAGTTTTEPPAGSPPATEATTGTTQS
jgi:hypothetical protein